MNRQLLGLAGVLVAGVAVALPSATGNSTPNVAFKKAALVGKVSPSVPRPEQMVSRMIVKMRDSSADDLARPMAAARVQALSTITGVRMKSVRAMADNASLLAMDAPLPLSEARAVAARLRSDPSVEYAEPDVMFKRLATPNDTRFFDWQWNLRAPASTYTGPLTGGGTKSATSTGGANLELAWDVTLGQPSVVIAVIDTGIVNHTDLNNAGVAPFSATYVTTPRFLAGYDFISGNVGAGTLPANFVANDGDGRDGDASDPGDWVTAEEETMYPNLCDDGQTGPQNSSWHGSHMAGVAAGLTNNTFGIAGIGWNVRVQPVRALGKCGGSLSDIAEAIRWAAGLPVPGVTDNPTPAQVINLSLGSDPSVVCDAASAMQSAVNAAIAAGALVVAATGNDGTVGLSSPAKCAGVIAVTAHTINGENADYANVGTGTTISSPGGGSPTALGSGGPTDDPNWFGFYIWSTTLWGDTTPISGGGANAANFGPNFSGFTGTSAATPQVAGVAALMKSIPAAAAATPQFVRSWITAAGNVRPHPANGACAALVFDCGRGLLDAQRALLAASNLVPAVSAGSNMVVLPGNNVALAGTATAYPGKNLTSTEWSRLSGPVVTLTGATTLNASFTAPASPSTVVLRLRATDSATQVADDFVSIRSNRPPTLGPIPPAQTVTIGQTVSFTVTATEPDGEPVFFAATSLPQGATFSSAGVFSWDTTTATPNSTSTFTYLATDGLSPSSAGSVAITVNAAAPAPPPGGAPPPTGGGGGGGATPFWQLILLVGLMFGAVIRRREQ